MMSLTSSTMSLCNIFDKVNVLLYIVMKRI